MTPARTTSIPVRLIDLVRSGRVMVVTPARINAAQARDGSIRTNWHVFRVEETLSNRSDGDFTRMGRTSCAEEATADVVVMRGELAVPFVDIDETPPPKNGTDEHEVISSFSLRPPPDWIPPEMGRRYLLIATDCGDGTARLPIGRMGLFEIDAAGSLTPVSVTPDYFGRASLSSIRELIADLARYDADVTPAGLLVGQVLDAVTNEPVASARVQISGVDQRDVQTTDDGWFVFRDVRAFTYDVEVTAYRWVTVTQRVRVDAGERRAGLSIRVHRLPALHGVLREENGRPIPMVWINASQVTNSERLTWNNKGQQTRTDDLGRYSFDALEPGDYLLHASINPLPEVEPDERTGLTFYPPSFYPDGSAPVNGTPVLIRSGEGSRQVDIVARPVAMRRVTGVVRGRIADATIQVGRIDPIVDPSGAATFPGRSARAATDGSFHVADLAPGEYVFTLMGNGRREPIARRVDVTRGDVAGVIFDVRDRSVVPTPAANLAVASGTARIEGVVSDIDAPGGAALARTRVTVTDMATGAVRRVQTDAQGTFQVARLAAGRYELLAERDGFLEVTPRGAADVPATVTVGEGAVASATLSMRRAGVVTGAVHDERGRPLPGYRVTLLRRSAKDGVQAMRDVQLEYRPIGGVDTPGVTGDDGRYRIFGVPSGEYVVMAVRERRPPSNRRTTREEVDQALADARQTPAVLGRPGVPDVPLSRYAPASNDLYKDPPPAYYPGTTELQAATPLRIEAGAELSGVDIVAIDQAPVSVSGEVRFDGDPTALSVTVQIQRLDLLSHTGRYATMQGDRRFAVDGVTPGRYAIVARTVRFEGSSRSMSGRAVVDVGTAAVDGIVVVAQPTGVVSGRLVTPGSVSLGSAPLAVRLEPVGEQDGTGEVASVAANGTFTLPHVAAGRYRLRVAEGVAAANRWRVRSVSLSGSDLPDEIVSVSPGANVTGVLVQLDAR